VGSLVRSTGTLFNTRAGILLHSTVHINISPPTSRGAPGVSYKSVPLFRGGPPIPDVFVWANWDNTSKRFPHQNSAVGCWLWPAATAVTPERTLVSVGYYIYGQWPLHILIYQPPSFKGGLRAPWDLRRRTEIIPFKDSHTRIKPLALSNGHGRYITVTRYTRTDTCVRWGMAVTYGRYKFVTVSLPKRFRNGRFTSELNRHLDPEVVKNIRRDF
jgi:hypothetical protein